MTIALWYHLRSLPYRTLVRLGERIAPPEVVTANRTNGFFASHIGACLVRLDVPQHLQAQGLTTDELAEAVGCDPARLGRLLLAAERFGYVRRRRSFWRSTRILQTLHPDSGTFGAQARFLCSPPHAPAWSRLDHVVRTGENAFRTINGMSIWDWYERHPEDAVDHTRLLDAVARYEAPNILAAYRFPSTGVICDVGGGTGGLLDEVLSAKPDLTGVLVELPGMIERAREYLADSSNLARIQFVSADVFQGFDVSADVYVLKSVLHDWNDDDASKILRSVRAAAPENARVVAIDHAIDMIRPSFNALITDLQVMCAYDQGRERSVDDVHDLLLAADLTPVVASTTVTNLDVVEAVVLPAQPESESGDVPDPSEDA